jgi:hypothetical protein
MTIEIQQPNVFDYILKIFGKKRAVYVPANPHKHGYYVAKRENFFQALFRSTAKPLPNGWYYMDDIYK